MAEDDSQMTTKKREAGGKHGQRPAWPANKPIPAFSTAREEAEFWEAHSFAAAMDARGEELVYEPQATGRARVGRCITSIKSSTAG